MIDKLFKSPNWILVVTSILILISLSTYSWYHEKDIYWCAEDIGWITGHSYIVYGPLANGATSIMFEGVPTCPNPDRFWKVVEKFKVNIFIAICNVKF